MDERENVDKKGMVNRIEGDDDLEFDDEQELDFGGEPDMDLDEDSEDDDYTPSVLYKGQTKPKTDDEWRQLLMEASRDGVPEYSLMETYNEGDLVLHPKFGMGVVAKVSTPTKMAIIFEADRKLMAMNVAPPLA